MRSPSRDKSGDRAVRQYEQEVVHRHSIDSTNPVSSTVTHYILVYRLMISSIQRLRPVVAEQAISLALVMVDLVPALVPANQASVPVVVELEISMLSIPSILLAI